MLFRCFFAAFVLASACGKVHPAMPHAAHVRWRDALNALARNHSVESSTKQVLINSAATACVRVAEWCKALAFVGRGPRRGDLVSFNVAITSVSSSRQWRAALTFFSAICESMLRRSAVSFGSVTKACDDLWDICLHLLKEFKQVEADKKTVAVSNSVSNALSSAGRWRDTLHVFAAVGRERLEMDGLSQTTCLTACSKTSGIWQLATSIFAKFRLFGRPHVITHNAAMRSCEEQWQVTLSLWSATQTDSVSDAIAMTSCQNAGQWTVSLLCSEDMALPGMCKLNRWVGALELLAKLFQGGKRDTVCHAATITACANASHWKIALSTLSTLSLVRVPRLPLLLAAALGASHERWEMALNFLQELRRLDSVDAIACNSCITACGKGSRWIEALHLLEAMESWSLKRSVISFNAAMTACDLSSQWQRSLLLLAELLPLKMRPSIVSYNAAIRAMAAEMGWKHVLELFEDLFANDLEPDMITFCGVLSGLVRGDRWELSINLSFPKSDVRLRNCILAACHRGALWQTALKEFRVKSPTTPTIVSCNATVSACGETSKWTEAMTLLREANENALQIDEVTFNAVMEAMPQWRLALKLLPHASSHFEAVRLCTKSSQWRRALGLTGPEADAVCEAVCETVLNAFLRTVLWQNSLQMLGEGLDVSLRAAEVFHESAQFTTALLCLESEARTTLNRLTVQIASGTPCGVLAGRC